MIAVGHLLLQPYWVNEAIFHMKKACFGNITHHVSTFCFDNNLLEKIISNARNRESGSLDLTIPRGNYAILKPRLSKSSPFEVKMLVEFIRRGILVFERKIP
jgi:hypothetical protein